MDKEKKIIGLVGPMASGKGTIAKYLKEKKGAEVFRFSTPLRDVLKRLHADISRINMQNISKALRESLGQDLLAKVIAKDVEDSNKKIVVVDGIRRWDDIKYLKDKKGFTLVAINVDSKIRYERMVKRGENEGDNNKTYEEFLSDHKKETELTIPEIMKPADETINNNSDLKNLYNQIDKIINE
ncbi:AAA family ATPase [bacterium]|nr:AAA family ATPase [bacterium]